jgi:hypothetical protein
MPLLKQATFLCTRNRNDKHVQVFQNYTDKIELDVLHNETNKNVYINTCPETHPSRATARWLIQPNVSVSELVAWPARSPDLSPLYFFVWGRLKSLVYETNCSASRLQATKTGKHLASSNAPVTCEVLYVVLTDGSRHFEQLLKLLLVN